MFVKSFIIFGCTLILFSCKPSTKSKNATSKSSNAELQSADNGNNVSYNAHIDFNDNARYEYSIINETATEAEVNGKSVDVLNKSDVGLTYDVQKDSAGIFVLYHDG